MTIMEFIAIHHGGASAGRRLVYNAAVRVNGKLIDISEVDKELQIGDVVMVGKRWEFVVGWDN